MEALDILEKRIDTLTRVLGPTASDAQSPSTAEEINKSAANESVVDSLLSANQFLNGAIADREQINNVFKRAPELEKYLDPNFLEENQQVRSKEVYLSAIAPELEMQFEQLDQIKQLETQGTLGAEYFRNIPSDRTEKLKQINEDNTEFAQQSELIEESLILVMKRYGELQSGLLETLAAMNKRLDAVEEKIHRKKREEQEKVLPIVED